MRYSYDGYYFNELSYYDCMREEPDSGGANSTDTEQSIENKKRKV